MSTDRERLHTAAVEEPELAFAPEEFAGRLMRLREAMAAAQIDVLFASAPETMCWLSGYAAAWYQGQSPATFEPATGLAVHVDHDRWIHFVGEDDLQLARRTSASTDLRVPGAQGMRDFVLDELAAEGWLDGAVVGLELRSSRPNRLTSEQFQAGLERHGARVVDASDLTRALRRRKSPAEMACVHQAQRIADTGLRELLEVIRPGMTELEAHGELLRALARAGGENPGIVMPVASGPRSACVHALSSRRVLREGDLVNVSATGVFSRYHASLGRTLSLGEPDPAVAARCAAMADAVRLVAGMLRPGLPVAELLRAVEAFYADAGILDEAWWVGGYEVGIAFPPDWVGGFVYQLGDDPGEEVFAPGEVCIYEANFYQPGGAGLATGISTMAFSADGAGFLTEMPFDLLVV